MFTSKRLDIVPALSRAVKEGICVEANVGETLANYS